MSLSCDFGVKSAYNKSSFSPFSTNHHHAISHVVVIKKNTYEQNTFSFLLGYAVGSESLINIIIELFTLTLKGPKFTQESVNCKKTRVKKQVIE